MQVDVIPCISEANSDTFINKTVIVIDVLRATSSIITALEKGCSGVIPVETVAQAKSLREDEDLLGGERFCQKIIGFDYGNSPTEFNHVDFKDKRMVMTTTNGIRAIQKSHKAKHIIAGAIMNAASCAAAALELNRDVIIVCAGTQDQFSLEDGLGAGMIIDEFMKLIPHIQLNDLGMAMYSTYIHVKDQLLETILKCANGKKLSDMGYIHDIEMCSHANLFSTVPILMDHVLVPYESSKIMTRS